MQNIHKKHLLQTSNANLSQTALNWFIILTKLTILYILLLNGHIVITHTGCL